ncbi:MAG: DNA replication/repair protein RecF [Rhodanobacteraceae bacterium]
MKIDLLRVTNLRCFEDLAFEPGSGLNWLVGSNGVGKTTLLEAVYLLSHGRSFRAGGRLAPCRNGASEYVVHATLSRAGRAAAKLGLARRNDRWQARLDGVDLPTLAPMFELCPVVYFGPESQSLVTGAAEERRSFLDWSVFHVEHDSLDLWRAWRRTLRQRNALLRSRAADDEFEPWEHDLARLAERIHAMRSACLSSLEPYLVSEAAWLVPELGTIRIDYRPGWDTAHGLQQQLAAHRNRERERGFTQHGVHRADWALRFERVAQREHLSRGQAKASALMCVLAQTRWLHDRIGEYPLLCLDDIESELDGEHASKVVGWLANRPMQAWLTTTAEPTLFHPADVFHVEHAGVTRRPDSVG